jgi:hypothetical protein
MALRMSARILVSLLALLMVWTSLTTAEATLPGFAQGAGGPVAEAGAEGGRTGGSVAHHHLDDVGAGGVDLPDEHAQAVPVPAVRPLPAARAPGRFARFCTAHLPGPQRPPCGQPASG